MYTKRTVKAVILGLKIKCVEPLFLYQIILLKGLIEEVMQITADF